ncbi:hypothetical protein [Streptomyces sp. NPDC014734]|uniref:hypothetical protein n=1 Tax=Streptomyces sp. NPDC014734 TaxID=3364886 RepID=UPI0037020954
MPGFTTLATDHAPRVDDRAHTVTGQDEGGPAMCDRTAAVSPRSRYEVILVSRCRRCPLRGRHRMPVTGN